MKLKKYKLGDLCFPDKIGIYGIPASAEDFSEDKIRYLRISDISDDGILLDNDKKSVTDKDIDKYILEENDMVFARTGNSTGRAYLYDSNDGILAFAGFLIKYQLDETKVNPKFVRYFTISEYYKQWVKNLSVGSTRGNISAQSFADCPILLPSRKQQDCTVKILSYIDRKIAINRAINQNLEAMAKQLYDYWFVQFDFPNEEGKPYKSSGGEMVGNEKLKRMIPQKWTNANIYQLASISKETVNPQINPNELFKHYSLPEYDKTGTYAEEYGIDIQSSKFTVTNNCILVSKLNPWTSRVICGNRESNQICSTEFVVWNPASMKTKGFLFMLAKNAKFIEYCTQGATGTSHSHRRINPELMMKFDFPYNSEIAIKFSLLIENITEQLHNNIAQLKSLTKQRDELLPVLMNGQVSVNSDLLHD